MGYDPTVESGEHVDGAGAALALVGGLPAESAAALALLDADARVLVASPALAALGGRTAADPVGRALDGVLPGEAGRRLGPLARQVAGTGADVDLELETQRDGEATTWLVALRRVDAEGPRVGLAISDVSVRGGLEAQLRESERQLEVAQRIAGMGWWVWTFDPPAVSSSPALAAVFGVDTDEPVEWSVDEWMAQVVPADRSRLRDAAGTAVANGDPIHLRFHFERPAGVRRLLEARAVPLRDAAGSVVGLQGFTQDVTAAERAGRQQRAVAKLGALGLGGDDVDDLLRRACELVAEALEAEFAGIQELSPATGELTLRRYVAPAGFVPRAAVPLGERTLSGYAIETDEPVLVEDWEHERRFPPTGPAAQGEARSAMCVAIHTPQRVYGTLTAYGIAPRRFSAGEIGFMQGAAHVLGEAIARRETAREIAQLAAARGRLVAQALDAEARARRGISERLHDGPLQDLLAAGHDLYGLGDRPDATLAQERLRAIAGDLREVMVALHPTVLRHGGLGAALQAVAGQLAHEGGFSTVVDVDEEAIGIHDELLLSLARQLVADAARHAAVGRVGLTLRREGDRLRLVVAHDGRPDPGQLGLATATERVAAVGGRLDATLDPAGGTRITVLLPVA